MTFSFYSFVKITPISMTLSFLESLDLTRYCCAAYTIHVFSFRFINNCKRCDLHVSTVIYYNILRLLKSYDHHYIIIHHIKIIETAQESAWILTIFKLANVALSAGMAITNVNIIYYKYITIYITNVNI